MLSFLNPIFLAALGALVIPLVLHLIQSSRTKRLPFSTIRFLKLAKKRSSRRIKLENLLLLLLRLSLLALLALAFAMPILRTQKFGNIVSRTARDVAIVIDASYSMNYQLNQQVIWNQATALATTIIEGLHDNDRFCVYLAGEQVTPICEQLTGKKEETTARLKALPKPMGSSRLAPATIAALGALDQDARRGERELHIISDHQLLPWGSFGNEDGATPVATADDSRAEAGKKWDPSKVKDNTTCFVTLLGTPEPENVATVDLTVEPKLITTETPWQVTVDLLRTGPQVNTAVSLMVNDREMAKRSAMLGGGAANQLQFMLAPMTGGVHTVKIATPEDSLAEDNAFHFLIRVREKLPALCVGPPGSTLFLKTALSAGTGTEEVSAVDVKVITPADLAAEKLSSYSCIFLCNALNLPGQQITLLERYVTDGGLLVIFPGDNAVLADYAHWTCLPAKPTSIIDLPVAERKQLLTWDRLQHPAVWGLAKEGVTPQIVIKRQLNCETLHEKSKKIISTGSGVPFLIDLPHGRGAVMLFTVAADRSWSDFPLSPFFLPLAYQMIQYAAGVGASPPFLWATDSLSLEEFLPDATRESTLTNPDGKPVSLRSSVVEGGTAIHAEGMTTPGIYTISTPGTETKPALAINIPRAESDLTAIKQEDISSILGLKALHLATSKEDLLKKLEDFRIGRSLGESFLWLALLVAVAEVFYANFLMRKGSKLTDVLTIEPSGKVKKGEA